MLIPVSLSLHYSLLERTHTNIQRTAHPLDHRQTTIRYHRKNSNKDESTTAPLQHRDRQIYSNPRHQTTSCSTYAMSF